MAFVLYFFSIEVPVSSYLNKVISKTGVVHCFWKDWAFNILPDKDEFSSRVGGILTGLDFHCLVSS